MGLGHDGRRRRGGIRRELRELAAVRTQLDRRDIAEATASLDHYERAFPAGALRTEASMLRIEALLARGDEASARKLARDLLSAKSAFIAHGPSSMHPGVACIACHTVRNGPSFEIAGTVYPSAHEPDDCNGANGTSGATVVITDNNGTVFNLPVNSVGNFHYDGSNGSVATPFHAKVVQGGKERIMPMAQTVGDCNSCHTQNGANNAPGRIMLP